MAWGKRREVSCAMCHEDVNIVSHRKEVLNNVTDSQDILEGLSVFEAIWEAILSLSKFGL